mgnify:CR=1 FL=1
MPYLGDIILVLTSDFLSIIKFILSNLIKFFKENKWVSQILKDWGQINN